MKRILALALAMLFLVSCGSPADTTADGTSDSPTVTDTPETNTPETDAPEETDEPSEFSGLTLTSDGKFQIHFANGYVTEGFDATNATAVYESAKALGYPGSLLGWLSTSALDIENRFYRGTGLGAKAFGKTLSTILENYDSYFFVSGVAKDGDVKVTETEGYMGEKGTSYPNSEVQTYRFTQRIEVSEGQTVRIVSDGNELGMRFVTAFSGSLPNVGASMIDTSCTTKKYVVPAGVTHVVATYRYTGKEVIAQLTGGRSNPVPVLKSKFDSEAFMELMTGAPVAFEPNLSGSVATLKDGYITIGNNDIMHNKTLRLICTLDGLADGQMIVLGHGETSYGGAAVEITNNTVRVYTHTNTRTDVFTDTHGMELSGTVEIEIKSGVASGTVSIENANDKYVSEKFIWTGRQGDIFAKSVGAELKDVQLLWKCSDYDKEIWLMGDSYFNTAATDRWPYYMAKDGYTDYLMAGFPGRNSQRAIIDFKLALEHGTPKYAVWCLGMNNKDSETEISATYKAATDEFLAICKEKGITPILTTTPNTPKVINIHKNAWVKSSGYRYIDFAVAVDAEEKDSAWIKGMISGDNVHPAPTGAQALYEQFIKDFPEIMG